MFKKKKWKCPLTASPETFWGTQKDVKRFVQAIGEDDHYLSMSIKTIQTSFYKSVS